MKEGDVRIVKDDEMNFAVEVVRLVELGKPGNRTGETELRWQNHGYYGSKIEWAFRGAVLAAAKSGGEITNDHIKDAYNAALKALKEGK